MNNHTWKLHLRYHLCPKCGNIIESRKDWEYRSGQYIKNLSCPKCHHSFVATQPMGPIGPIFGEPSKTEFDWS